jgi:large-conductance mechanosensitive channel
MTVGMKIVADGKIDFSQKNDSEQTHENEKCYGCFLGAIIVGLMIAAVILIVIPWVLFK